MSIPEVVFRPKGLYPWLMKDDFVIYELVKSEDKKRLVFGDLAKNQGEVFIRAEHGIKISFAVNSAKISGVGATSGNIVGTLQSIKENVLKVNQTVSVWFYQKNDTFYFECKPHIKGVEVLLNFSGDLFRLQRRTEFRFEIPEGYPATFEVQKRDSGLKAQKMTVADLNASGLGLLGSELDNFKQDERIKGLLTLGKHSPITLDGQVRHLHQKDNRMHIGIEAIHRGTSSEVDLLNLLMMFRREIFNKLTNNES